MPPIKSSPVPEGVYGANATSVGQLKTGIDHYENFPVASVLCPPHLRPAIAAIYWFARTADDIADEGDAPPEVRLNDLAAYHADLMATAAGLPASPQWAAVFQRLGPVITQFSHPGELHADHQSAV